LQFRASASTRKDRCNTLGLLQNIVPKPVPTKEICRGFSRADLRKTETTLPSASAMLFAPSIDAAAEGCGDKPHGVRPLALDTAKGRRHML
jgi:hypothetical protein